MSLLSRSGVPSRSKPGNDKTTTHIRLAYFLLTLLALTNHQRQLHHLNGQQQTWQTRATQARTINNSDKLGSNVYSNMAGERQVWANSEALNIQTLLCRVTVGVQHMVRPVSNLYQLWLKGKQVNNYYYIPMLKISLTKYQEAQYCNIYLTSKYYSSSLSVLIKSYTIETPISRLPCTVTFN